MSDSDRFTMWFKADAVTPALKLTGSFLEPAQAADRAELHLEARGTPGASWVELRLNGDPEPHTIVFYLEDETFGIWNTDIASWPIYYAEGSGGEMLDGNPFPEIEDSSADEAMEGDDGEASDESGFGDEDEDSDVMDLSGGDDDENESEPEEEDGSDEEDDSSDDDDEGDTDGDSDKDDNGEAEDDELDEGDSHEDDEAEDGDPEPDLKEEDEMPRIKLFAKLRGPLGWRKRAESEELNEVNLFEMVVGKLNTDAVKAKDQERDTLVHIRFIEGIDAKEFGLLHIEVPKGTLFKWDADNSAWIAQVDYNTKEN